MSIQTILASLTEQQRTDLRLEFAQMGHTLCRAEVNIQATRKAFNQLGADIFNVPTGMMPERLQQPDILVEPDRAAHKDA
jgi:hypothetical protein